MLPTQDADLHMLPDSLGGQGLGEEGHDVGQLGGAGAVAHAGVGLEHGNQPEQDHREQQRLTGEPDRERQAVHTQVQLERGQKEDAEMLKHFCEEVPKENQSER